MLEHGKIKERGNHEALIEQKGIYNEMYRMQQKGVTTSHVKENEWWCSYE